MDIFDELYHYGVKGMKWGVRRYQNADGSLTDAGKKRLAKDIKRRYKSVDTYNTRRGLIRDVSMELREKYGRQLDPYVANIRDKRKFHEKVFSIEQQYYKSDDYKKDLDRSVEDTYKWYKKNKPDRLKEMLKYNSKDELLDLDDWDYDEKHYEFYEKYTDAGVNRYYKNNGLDVKAAQNAWHDYQNACTEAGKFVVGQYGSMSLSKINGWKNVEQVVADAVKEMEKI